MGLSAEDIEAIAERTAARLSDNDRAFFVPMEQHYQDHLMIRQMRESNSSWNDVVQYIKEEKQAKEKRKTDARTIRNQVLGVLLTSGILGMMGLFGAWAINAIANMVKAQGGP